MSAQMGLGGLGRLDQFLKRVGEVAYNAQAKSSFICGTETQLSLETMVQGGVMCFSSAVTAWAEEGGGGLWDS